MQIRWFRMLVFLILTFNLAFGFAQSLIPLNSAETTDVSSAIEDNPPIPVTPAEDEELLEPDDIDELNLSQITRNENLEEVTVQDASRRVFLRVSSEARKQWEKLKIDASLPLISRSFPMGKHFEADIGAKYHFVSQPAFIKDYHQRIDGYSMRLGGAGNVDQISAGAKIEASMTFSRILRTKTESLVRFPVSPLDFPLTAKIAYERLSAGQAGRLELSSNGSFGIKENKEIWKDLTSGHFNIGASFNRGALFLFDFYKLKDQLIRARIVANRNQGSGGFSVGVSVLDIFDSGTQLLNTLLTRIFRCDLFSINKTKSLLASRPLDTVMIDYVFDLKKPEGRLAYNAMMRSVREIKILKHVNFLKIKNWSNDVEALNSLLSFTQKPEEQFMKDRNKRFGERAVDRFFKGRAITKFNSFNIGTNCGISGVLWRGGIVKTSSSTAITHYNHDDIQQHFILNNYNRNGKFEAFKTFGFDHAEGVNNLFVADRRIENDKYVYYPTTISDLIFTRDIKEKTFKVKEFERLRSDLETNSAEIYRNIDWGGFGQFPNGRKKANAGVRYNYVFHKELLDVLPPMERNEIRQIMRDFIDSHPNKSKLDTDQQLICDRGQCGDKDRFDPDLDDMSRYFSTALSTQDPAEKMKQLNSLNHKSLFRDIGAGILLILINKLSDDQRRDLKKLVYFSINGSAEDGGVVKGQFGTNDISQLYRSAEFIINLINDRSFDLKMQIDENGLIRPYNSSNPDNQECGNCL